MESREIGLIEGLGDQIALQLVHTGALEEFSLAERLDAFRGDLEAQAVPQVDDGLEQPLAGGVLVDLSDEAPIDLELLHGQSLDIGQGRLPRPEIIQRQRDADGAQRAKHFQWPRA